MLMCLPEGVDMHVCMQLLRGARCMFASECVATP